ncbi:acyltransferase family protein [Paenibacillus gansuensis]|uniref:Acyltransferase family protein n=1 Tax=Paenibacillus gansuensis TaxID=306542 RepID=A0ABW5PGM6_9BACL
MAQLIQRILGMDKSKHIPQLDGIRAIAVLMVFVYHAWGMSGSSKFIYAGHDVTFLISWGHAGVDLFYVLSGFLLFLPFVRSHDESKSMPNIKNYIIRRSLRIIPIYYVYIILTILLTSQISLLSSQGVKTLLINFLFLQGFFPEYMINGVTWTLANEI